MFLANLPWSYMLFFVALAFLRVPVLVTRYVSAGSLTLAYDRILYPDGDRVWTAWMV